MPESIGACDRQRLKIKLLPTHKCRAFDADTGARNIAWERVQFKGMTKVFQKGLHSSGGLRRGVLQDASRISLLVLEFTDFPARRVANGAKLP